MKNRTYNKKKMLVVFCAACIIIFGLIARLVYLMIFDAGYYQKKAEALHEREREIKAARGEIVDRNGNVLATNKTVCTISVIHSQIEDPQAVIQTLARELEMEEASVRRRVEKVSSMEKVKTNVDKETGDLIRGYNLAGVKVDEDFKRYYVYDELASKVLGFTGGDNQGIIGLEVKYEDDLKGKNGTILTVTDARGIELEGVAEDEYVESYDIALQRVVYMDGGKPHIALLYADYKQEGYYLSAQIVYLLDQQDEAYPTLLAELGDVFALNLPEIDPFE